MKKFFDKIQDLGQKAGQFRSVLESAPDKAAQLRDAVMMTAGQLTTMRKDVQATMAGLRAEDEHRLTSAMKDVHEGLDQIRAAGYELVGVEMELDPVQRLILLLEKFEDVSAHELQHLLTANAHRKTLHGVLASLIKAEEFAGQFDVGELEYRQLRVSVGPIPSVRLVWKEERRVTPPPIVTPPPVQVEPTKSESPKAAEAAHSGSPFFGTQSYFEPRDKAESSVATGKSEIAAPEAPKATFPPDVQLAPASPSVPPLASSEHSSNEVESEPEPEPGAAWRSSALDRFKKMPDLTARRK